MRNAAVRSFAVSKLLRASLPAVILTLAACGKSVPPAAPASAVATPPAAAVTPIPKGPPVQVTPERVAAGRRVFVGAGCSACHGAAGGGGVGPPLTNDVWIYGQDDETLRVLIERGTAGMAAHGKTRVGQEKRVGQMPPFAAVLKEGDTETLLAFIHSIDKTAGAVL